MRTVNSTVLAANIKRIFNDNVENLKEVKTHGEAFTVEGQPFFMGMFIDRDGDFGLHVTTAGSQTKGLRYCEENQDNATDECALPFDEFCAKFAGSVNESIDGFMKQYTMTEEESKEQILREALGRLFGI